MDGSPLHPTAARPGPRPCPGHRGARGVPAASAAILIPTTTADSFDGACDAQCSLRDAFAAANSTPGADVIVLGPGTWTLSRAGAGEDATATGDLDVTGELSIVGAGAVQTVIDGASLDRVLDVAPGASVEIRGVTIRNGSAADDGGAIRDPFVTLLLDRSLVTVSSSRDGSGGGIFSDGELARHRQHDLPQHRPAARRRHRGRRHAGARQRHHLQQYRRLRRRPLHLRRDRGDDRRRDDQR